MNKIREEIMEMPAGREMDKMIAEKVMGIKTFLFLGDYRFHVDNEDEEFDCPVMDYSTRLLPAWQVVNKLQYLNLRNYGDWVSENSWSCQFSKNGFDEEMVDADTAPLAICRAALIKVMVIE